MLKALADAQVRAVPPVRKRRVRADNEGVVRDDGVRISVTGYKE
jgi:hypothetical protein